MSLNVTQKEALLAKRKGLIEDARATLQLSSEANGGNPTNEALDESNKLIDAADAIHKQIEDDERLDARSKATNARLATVETSLRQGTGRITSPPQGADSPHLYVIEFGRHRMDARRDPAMARRNSQAYEEAFDALFRGGRDGPMSAMQLDNAESGGVLAPPRFVAQLIKELDELMVFRQVAKVLPPGTSREISYPRRTTRERRTQKGQTWTPPAGTDAALGTATWTLHPWTGECQINKSLMQFAALDVQAYIRNEINYDRAATQEQAFMTGDGIGTAYGCFTAATAGLPTSADVVSAGAIGYDTIVNFKFALRDVYLNSKTLRVLSHRNFQKTLLKIRTTDGVTLFQPSLRVGEPDTMLGVPMMFSEFAPAGTSGVYANNDYAAVIGDFNEYWIYESSDLSIEMHDLDTRSNLKSFLYRNWFDGNFAQREAFKRLQKTA